MFANNFCKSSKYTKFVSILVAIFFSHTLLNTINYIFLYHIYNINMLTIEWNNDVIHGGLSTCVLTKDLVLGVLLTL